LAAAETLLDTGHHPDAVSRAYYGVYEAARALLLVKDVETSEASLDSEANAKGVTTN
jgi:uncharacterized protein (UPF0332 family)